ncbi:hypothetical protein ACEWY4_016961 [Coilia grayii]|uniref:FZ domain-containing protein n=1 Tax=Coilia grayii TaxID=363190 RepID=A0ABD1JLW6_9TELE
MVDARLCLGLCLALALHAAPLHAWFWNFGPQTITPAGPAVQTPAGSGAPGGESKTGEKITVVGSEILDVANGIKQLVQSWDETAVSGGTGTGSGAGQTGNEGVQVERLVAGQGQSETGGPRQSSGGGGGKGSGGLELGARSSAESGDSGLVNTTSGAGTQSSWPRNVTTPAWMSLGGAPATCLPRDPAWAFCSSADGDGGGGGGRRSGPFAVPNFLNLTRAEEVGAVLGDWALLLSSACHRDVERFFCLLLTPPCPHGGAGGSALPQLPCRSLCEILMDACWATLGGRGLPVTCDSLPEGLPHERPCQPVSSCRCAGNARLKCIQEWRRGEEEGCIFNQHVCGLLVVCVCERVCL